MRQVGTIKLSRVVSAGIVLLILAVAFALLGKTLAYFKTGAEDSKLHLINTDVLSDHNPKVTWLDDKVIDGRVINEYIRKDLEEAYVQAWHVANLSLANQNGDHLQDCFADKALAWITKEVKDSDNLILHQIDLIHNLQLHHFTLDNQLAAFSDRNVRVIKRIKDKSGILIYEEEKYYDYDVVMTLDDGRWRIKHLVKKIIEDPEDSIVLAKDQKMLSKLEFIRGVNYYPAGTPWFDFWDKYDEQGVQKDLALAKKSGFNTTRIFVQYEVFGGAKVKQEMLDKLESFLDISEKLRLKVVVTLFDFPKSYALSNYTNTDRHLEKILSRFKNHIAILAWDIKNEPDLDYKNYGQKTVNDWLSFAIKQARRYDANHLITIGWSDAESAHSFYNVVDFVSFHHYRSPATLAKSIKSLRSKVKSKKIMLSEFGQTSLSSIWTLYTHSEKNQARYFEEILDITNEEEVPFISWSLHDFEKAPTKVFGRKPWVRNPQKHYGLYRSDGTSKPVLAVLRK